MSFWTALFGGGAKAAGEGIAAPINAIGNVFDQLFTSDEEREKAAFVLEKLRQQPHLLQSEINLAQAQHRTLFVAGPRPFIMWVCGFALAWHFIGYDLALYLSVTHFPDMGPIPPLTGTGELMSLTLALLGLGGMRSLEKKWGVAK